MTLSFRRIGGFLSVIKKWDRGPSASVRARQQTEAMVVHFSVVNRVKGRSMSMQLWASFLRRVGVGGDFNGGTTWKR
jgi:hypothetical protein